MSASRPPLILASASPRRRTLLEEHGYAFTIIPAEIEEISPAHPKCVDHVALARDFKVDLDDSEDALDGEEGGWKHYAITDKLNVLPGYSTDLVYYSAIRRTKTGMEALTNPGSGVTIYGKFSR